MIKLKAHAKLNLFLEVVGKRPSGEFAGYHELESLAVFLDLADELSVEPHDELVVEGEQFENNLVLKAAKLLKERSGCAGGAKFHLQKNIPVSGGLGGGSADAAAAIFMLNGLWDLQLNEQDLFELAARVGADVPACLYSIIHNKNAVYFSGIGENLLDVPHLKNMFFVLVNPHKEASTQEVFVQLKLDGLKARSENGMDFLNRENHLEVAAGEILPEISEVLAEIEKTDDVLLSRMSGSGATCFGLYETEEIAKKAEAKIAKLRPEWLVKFAKLKN